MTETPPRTIGQALADTEVLTVASFAGFALVVIGSLGPWATTPLTSLSGISGDGKITIIAAAFGTFVLVLYGRDGARTLAVIACVVALATSVYDAINIQHVASKTILFGAQLAQVGWGVYVVIVGALITLVALMRGRQRNG